MIGSASSLLLLAVGLGSSSPPLFDSDSLIDVALSGPLTELLDDEDSSEHAFLLAHDGVARPVQVQAYGKSRRRVCSFPSLLVRFESTPAATTGVEPDRFAGVDFLRLTNRCKNTSRARTDLVEEYLAYRIINLLTDVSYRVRLLRVDYIDPENSKKSVSAYAFATESETALAARLGGQVLEVGGLPKARLNEEHAAIVYVFQYLIGNTDWSLVSGTGEGHCCHNGQLITIDGEIFYIPYDFDISGLVNPHYAKPDPSFRIRRVTNRLYRGYCGPPAALREALAHVVRRRDAILDLYRQAPLLTPSERERGIGYLESFFRKAENPEKLLERFSHQCLG